MIDDIDKESFRLDPQARSFRLTGFRWRDAPVALIFLALSFVLLTGFSFLVERGLSFLGRDTALFVCGVSLGFLIGVWVGESRATARNRPHGTVDRANPPPLSDRINEVASDPSRKIEAIKAYRDETGASLAEAKRIVEESIRRNAK